MLGQGTIYPDTIESGGTSNAAVIKTHHNRVERITELIREGRVLEPLAEFYKDEVRMLGRALGLPKKLVERHPFPGPALAIRCLCAAKASRPHSDEEIDAVARAAGYRAFLLPVRSVGVQGDSRSYAELTVLHGGGARLPQAAAGGHPHHQPIPPHESRGAGVGAQALASARSGRRTARR